MNVLNIFKTQVQTIDLKENTNTTISKAKFFLAKLWYKQEDK